MRGLETLGFLRTGRVGVAWSGGHRSANLARSQLEGHDTLLIQPIELSGTATAYVVRGCNMRVTLHCRLQFGYTKLLQPV